LNHKSVAIAPNDYEPIMDLMKYDKKNEHGNINFVLLETIGKPVKDCLVDNGLIVKAFEYYKSITKSR
jgi:3-dehydroquinate synthase